MCLDVLFLICMRIAQALPSATLLACPSDVVTGDGKLKCNVLRGRLLLGELGCSCSSNVWSWLLLGYTEGALAMEMLIAAYAYPCHVASIHVLDVHSADLQFFDKQFGGAIRDSQVGFMSPNANAKKVCAPLDRQLVGVMSFPSEFSHS